jgi:hypothetical protein
MKLPRVQLTVRRLIVAVALVALLLGAARLWALRQLYLERAAGHAGFRALVLRSPQDIQYWESRWTDRRAGRPARYPWPAGPPFVPAIARYHDDMKVKYERAAARPWLPVGSDPPEPR